MGDNDWSTKAALAVLIFLGGLMFYRMQHPATTFAAEGTDPDWDAAAQHARDVHQPSVVLFTADWCHYCRDLEAIVLPRSDVQAELRHYTFFTVDMSNPDQQASDRARKFHVNGYPCLIRYDANGKETARTNFMEGPQLIDWLKAGE